MDVFRYLSHPAAGDFHSLAAELCTLQFHAFVSRARGRLALPQHAALLDEVLEGLSSTPPHRDYWTPEVSWIQAGEQARSGHGQPALHDEWQVAQIATAAFLTGVLDRVALRTRLDLPLLVAGRTFLGELQIEGRGDQLRIQSGSNTLATFIAIARREGRTVWIDASVGAQGVIGLEGEFPIRCVGGDWHRSSWIGLPCQDAPVADTAHQVQSALDLLRSQFPEYHAWVTCLLKEVTPIVRPAPRMLASNSSWLRMGGIDVSVPASVTETVEMLVHECTHQYFHMCAWLGSTVVPGAKPHFSPLKQCERPLDRILLGYHAFGNALIVFDKLAALGRTEEIRVRWTAVAAYMDKLAEPLQPPHELSELGLALFSPLHARLGTLQNVRPPALTAASCRMNRHHHVPTVSP
jgi:HEXXH motif-containing protein